MSRTLTIAVAIDPGEGPDVVLRHAVAWGRHLRAELHVVTVSDDPRDDVLLGELGNQLPAELRGRFTRIDVPHGSDDAGGPDGARISEALARIRADVLLVGTHARRGLGRLLFGSVAETVVRDAALPVLVCPLHAEPAVAPLVAACPIDPDETDWSAVRWVASHLPASIQVLAAYPHETTLQQIAGADLDDEVRTVLEAGLSTLGEGVDVTLHGLPGLSGNPGRVLAEAAERIGVDLVAMTSHQRQGPSRWLYGSVAETVIRAADCAVLVLPMTEAALDPGAS